MDSAKLQAMLAKYPCAEIVGENGGVAYITCPARLAFAALDKPKPPMSGSAGEPKFQTALVFPVNADLSVLKSAAGKAASEKFGARLESLRARLKSPFRDQGEKAEDYEGYEAGGLYINVSSQFKPPVLDGSLQVITDYSKVYSGMWVRAKLTCYAFDKAGSVGVAFGLVSLQKLADDERFASQIDTTTGFGPATGGAASAGTNGKAAADLF